FDSSVLSISTQRYLRTFPESEWQKLKGILENNRKQNLRQKNSKFLLPSQISSNGKSISNSSSFPGLPFSRTSSDDENHGNEATFIQALSELQTYQFSAPEPDFSKLITQISKVREGYNLAIDKALQIETGQVKKPHTAPIILELTDN
ncbi:MAG: phosphohydrolase, partial [Aphanizomenon sp.]